MAKKKDIETKKVDEEQELDSGPSADEEETLESENDPSQKENEIDYEAIALQESERADRESDGRRKAEKILADNAFKSRERNRESGDSEEGDKPLTEARLLEILADQEQRITRTTQSGTIVEIVKGIASSEAEARAIIATHRNRTWPADVPLEQQIREASAIVNAPRNSARMSEMRRALNGRENMQRDSTNTQRDGQGGGGNTPPKIAQGTATVMTQGGFKWDAARKLYSKKLQNGKTLFANPKAGHGEKRQWIE